MNIDLVCGAYMAAELGDRVTRTPLGLFLARPVSPIAIAHPVTVKPVGFTDQQGWAVTPAAPCGGPAGGLAHVKHVHAVNSHGGNTKGSSSVANGTRRNL